MARATLIATIVAVFGIACSATPDVSDTPGTSENAGPLVAELPSGCEGASPGDDTSEISFVANGRLYVSNADGSDTKCIAKVGEKAPLSWAPGGSSLALSRFEEVEVYVDDEKKVLKGPGEHPLFLGFSQPDGEHLLFLAYDGSSLEKVEVATGKSQDISFLRRHDEAIYSPSGDNIAVIGEPQGEPYGIFVVDENGKHPQRLVVTDREDEFYALTYSYDGETLYYIEDLHDRWELRSVPADGGSTETTKLAGSDEPFRPYVSTYGDDIAYRDGGCDTVFTTYIVDGEIPTEVDDDGESQPIGWTEDGSLVTGVADDLCDSARTLDIYIGDADQRTLFVEDVDEAAVRPAG
jgi:hypothetical protein